MNDTDKLSLATHTLNNEKSLFPESFISAVRECLDVGITSEQLTAIVLLSVGILKTGKLDIQDLIGRTREVSNVLLGLEKHEAVCNKKKRI